MKFSQVLLSGALAVAMGLPIAGYAQDTPTQAPGAASAEHHHGGAMRMLRGVNLTDQQKAQIKQIMQQYHQQHPQGSAPDPAARKALHQQILNVLTPAQQAQVKANMQHSENGESPHTAPSSSPR